MIYHIYSQFKHHKRGWISCKILLGIFILSLFSNFIANDKPIIISYKNHIFFPQLSYLTLEDFGETLPIAVDYNLPAFNKKIYDSGGWVIPSPIPYSYNTIDFYETSSFPSPPSYRHLLGTDAAGHDVVSILLYGLRISIIFGMMLSLLSSLIGIFVGALCGYFGGLVDLIGQRFLELWSSLPTLYILIILSSITQPSFGMLLLIMTCVSWMSVVNVVRAEFFRVRGEDFVTCAQIMGANHLYLSLIHI